MDVFSVHARGVDAQPDADLAALGEQAVLEDEELDGPVGRGVRGDKGTRTSCVLWPGMVPTSRARRSSAMLLLRGHAYTSTRTSGGRPRQAFAASVVGRGDGGVQGTFKPRPRPRGYMRALLAALLLLAPPAAAGDPPGPTCGLTVCAEARSTIDIGCVEAREGTDAVLTCTFVFTSFTWGHSPLLLAGRVFLGGDAIAAWSCTQGCAPQQVEKKVNAYATWWGGPEVPSLDLGSGDGGDVVILVQEAVLRAPPGSGACLHYDLSLETTALAETPHLPSGLPGGWLEEVYDGDGAIPKGSACLA